MYTAIIISLIYGIDKIDEFERKTIQTTNVKQTNASEEIFSMSQF